MTKVNVTIDNSSKELPEKIPTGTVIVPNHDDMDDAYMVVYIGSLRRTIVNLSTGCFWDDEMTNEQIKAFIHKYNGVIAQKVDISITL